MTDPSVESCQVCGAGPVEKVLFPVAVHFKGSGFYSTDYGRGSRKGASKDGDSSSGGEKTEKSEQKDASSTPASDSGSSTKPEKKAD